MSIAILSRLAAIAGVALLSGPCGGAPPTSATAFGMALGTTPASATAIFARNYGACSPTPAIYHALSTDKTPYVAALAINPGLARSDVGAADFCSSSPAGEGVTDGIEVRFVHPAIDPGQIAYQIEGRRLYPDVVYAKPAKLRTTFDEIRRQLFATYGRPLEERRERVASSAADLAKSLGIGGDVKREDVLVRYLWADEGKLDETHREAARCDCKGRYVSATLEISRSPATTPKNVFYVLSVTLVVDDPTLRLRQAQWDAQWLTTAK